MTIPIVPVLPPLISTAQIRSGLPVRGKTLSGIADMINWCVGNGVTLVPMHTPRIEGTGAWSKTVQYKVFPRYHALRRVWLFQVTAGLWDIAVPTGGDNQHTRTIVPPPTDYGPRFLMAIEDVAAGGPLAGGETLITADIGFTPTAGYTVGIVNAIGVYEMRRANLDPAAATPSANQEKCVLAQSLTAGEQIYYDSDNEANSYGGLSIANASLPDVTTRGGMFSWWSDDDAASPTISSGVSANLFAADPIVLTQKIGRSATVGELIALIAAKCSDGSTAGTVTFTATSGDAVTITVPAGTTSTTWIAGGAFDADCEDLSSATGRRSNRWDKVAITGVRTAGAGSIYLRGGHIGHESV